MLFRSGANRTGRFASKRIQLQNLPKNHMDDLDDARRLLKAGDFKTLTAKYPDVQDVLSQLVRTAFVPGERSECIPPARKETFANVPASPSEQSLTPVYCILNPDPCILSPKFLVADESAIEARILSYLSGERWRIRAFAEGQDIYCASASQMFHVPVEKNGQNATLRTKGKVAELALGYGGSVGALEKMGALEMGLEESELQPIVDAWRAANPRIVKFWYDVGDAAMNAVIYRATTQSHGFRFIWEKASCLSSCCPGGGWRITGQGWAQIVSGLTVSRITALGPRRNGNSWRPTGLNSWKTSSRPRRGMCSAMPSAIWKSARL